MAHCICMYVCIKHVMKLIIKFSTLSYTLQTILIIRVYKANNKKNPKTKTTLIIAIKVKKNNMKINKIISFKYFIKQQQKLSQKKKTKKKCFPKSFARVLI